MKKMLAIIILILNFGCSRNEKHVSPTGKLYFITGVYDINTNQIDRSKHGFVLFDKAGYQKESVDLSRMGGKKVSISWLGKSDTLLVTINDSMRYIYKNNGRLAKISL